MKKELLLVLGALICMCVSSTWAVAGAPGFLVVETIPGVEVSIEGQLQGVTGESLFVQGVPPGEYILLARREGYFDKEVPITIKPGEAMRVQLRMEQADVQDAPLSADTVAAEIGIKTGVISIRSIPLEGAAITLNDQRYSVQTNRRFHGFPVGDIDVAIEYEGSLLEESFRLEEDKVMMLLANYAQSPPELVELFDIYLRGPVLLDGVYVEVQGDYHTTLVADWDRPLRLMGPQHTMRITDGVDYFGAPIHVALTRSSVVYVRLPGTPVVHLLDDANFTMRFAQGAEFPVGTDDSLTSRVESDFWIGETEVPYELWYSVCTWAEENGYVFANFGQEGSNGEIGAKPLGTGSQPVTMVSWRDAIVWCNALTEYYNELHGLSRQPVYTADSRIIRDATRSEMFGSITQVDGFGFRLPTPDEWELAARFEPAVDGALEHRWTPGSYASGAHADIQDAPATEEVARYGANAQNQSWDSRSRAANGLGLYDMSGNVSEWCFDLELLDHGRGIVRGGAYNQDAPNLQIGRFFSQPAATAAPHVGFRLAQTAKQIVPLSFEESMDLQESTSHLPPPGRRETVTGPPYSAVPSRSVTIVTTTPLTHIFNPFPRETVAILRSSSYQHEVPLGERLGGATLRLVFPHVVPGTYEFILRWGNTEYRELLDIGDQLQFNLTL